MTDTPTAVCDGAQGRMRGWVESMRRTWLVSEGVREDPVTKTCKGLSGTSSISSRSLLTWEQVYPPTSLASVLLMYKVLLNMSAL